MSANLENSVVATGLEKVSFHSNPKERQCQRMLKLSSRNSSVGRALDWRSKEYSNYHTIALVSHASQVMPKILQARLQQYMNRELPDVQAGFRKGRGTRDQIDNIHSWKSKRVLEKHLFLLYWLCQSLWLCGSQETVENSERDGNTRLPDLPPEKSVCRSGSNS